MSVYVLPAPPRTLNAVRQALNARARVRGVSERSRLHAVGVAFAALADGASSAWATQQGIQDMREPRWVRSTTGDAA